MKYILPSDGQKSATFGHGSNLWVVLKRYPGQESESSYLFYHLLSVWNDPDLARAKKAKNCGSMGILNTVTLSSTSKYINRIRQAVRDFASFMIFFFSLLNSNFFIHRCCGEIKCK